MFYTLTRTLVRVLALPLSGKSVLPLLALGITTSAGAQYTQNFDTITTTGTATYNNLPEGWGIYEVGTGTAADGRYVVNNGSNNAGNAYSYGATGSTDRALGTLGSGGNSPTIGAIFFNETDFVITSVTISFTMEQWRFGGVNTTTRPSGTPDVVPFSYSLDATSISNTAPGTWVAVPQLNLSSVITSGTAGALDGNAAANRQAITYTITGLSIAPGGSLLIRWADSDTPGSDDGLSIDDFTISAGLAPGVLSSGATNTGGGGGGGGGTPSTGTSTSTPIFQHQVATDSGFLHLYGNLHGHSTHSDGRPSTQQPIDDYNYARTVLGMDFLGISEHNHSTAGLQILDYKIGYQQAESVNGQPNLAGQPFLTLHGMEWGTISGGGHVLVYGFRDSLINWEAGNYDIFVNKSDYITLFDSVRKHLGAFATLAHPNSGDYTGLTGGYKGVADSAVVGVAIESGPAFSTATNYSDYPASLAYINYFRNLLRQGYRVAPQMDQDNHEMTFGSVNGNRMVVLSKERTREALTRSIRGMRFYASNDFNAQVGFALNNFIMGSSILDPMNGIITVNHTDGNGEGLSAVQVYGGRVGGTDATLLHTATASTSFMTTQPLGETWYYYSVLTQADGNRMITAPIWLTRPAGAALPVTLTEFRAVLQGTAAGLSWTAAQELGTSHYELERSTDGRSYMRIATVAARGSGSTYRHTDPNLSPGATYYRLKMVDADGSFRYSPIVSVNWKKDGLFTVSPNPASDRISIRAHQALSGPVQVQLIDMAGNRVYNARHVFPGSVDINVQPFAPGTYVIRIGDELHKLIIRR